MPITTMQNSRINALDVAFSIHADIEAKIYDALYPDHEWPGIVAEGQVKRNVNAGATSVAYQTRDHKGVAAFIGSGPNNDIPMVGQSMGAVDVPMAVSAVGFRVTNEDARQFSFGFNSDLPNDLSNAAGKASENLIEKSIIFGNNDLKFLPWLNYPGVAITPSLDNGSGSTRWADKTPMQKVDTLNSLLRTMWENTRTLFVPTDLYVPMAIFSDMVQTPMIIGGGSGTGLAVSIMDYFKANNLCVALPGGRKLNIIPSRYLSEAGADGQGRIIAMNRDVENQAWPFPLEYRIGQPVPEPLGAAWYGEQKFGSYHVRQIGSMLYMDGI